MILILGDVYCQFIGARGTFKEYTSKTISLTKSEQKMKMITKRSTKLFTKGKMVHVSSLSGLGGTDDLDKMKFKRKKIFTRIQLYFYFHNIFHFFKKASSGEITILC